MKVTKEDKLRSLKQFYNITGIYSVDDISRKHQGHWFSKDTMRFFKSRLVQDVFPTKDKVYFVSSEQGPNGIRSFSVRCYEIKTDDIKTVGEFGGYGTKATALTGALNAAYNSLEVK